MELEHNSIEWNQVNILLSLCLNTMSFVRLEWDKASTFTIIWFDYLTTSTIIIKKINQLDFIIDILLSRWTFDSTVVQDIAHSIVVILDQQIAIIEKISVNVNIKR